MRFSALKLFIFKIHSSRLRKNRWQLTLPIEEARKNDEVISLASSQTLRWIDSINDIQDADSQAKAIKKEIKTLRNGEDSVKALTTLLPNDFSTFSEKIAGGAKKSTVLIFEVEKAKAESISNVSLRVEQGTSQKIILIN